MYALTDIWSCKSLLLFRVFYPGWFLLLTASILLGGVPGGVLEGELLTCDGLLCMWGIQIKQRSLGLGPKLIPRQLVHGGVGGGVHGDTPLLGGGERLGRWYKWRGWLWCLTLRWGAVLWFIILFLGNIIITFAAVESTLWTAIQYI